MRDEVIGNVYGEVAGVTIGRILWAVVSMMESHWNVLSRRSDEI